MDCIGWLIVILPMIFVIGAAVYVHKYVRGVADYLAAGRVAGRYVICVGDLQAGLAVITLVAMCEAKYQCGVATSFWYNVQIPIGIMISLMGYCIYRFRQTRCLSIGQFFEIRYNRVFRVVASLIRTSAEILTNAIAPAIAARFFIYFLGFPHHINLWGYSVPTFVLVVIFVVTLAVMVILPGGRVSLIITDCIQGLISYPIFLIFTIFILYNLSWGEDIAPVMMDRVPGESFLDPTDIKELRDFNLFGMIVVMVGQVLNRAAWIGNDTSCAGRTPHEQKMASVLGVWRTGFSTVMCTLIALTVITIMSADRFSEKAKDVRIQLSTKVLEEVIPNKKLCEELCTDIGDIPAANHKIGFDRPYSRTNNPDIPYMNTVYNGVMKDKSNGAFWFQKFRTLYYQMMMPMLLRNFFPSILMGLFVLLMLMLMISTDDSRIFNSSSTLLQDVIMPFHPKALSPKEHLWYLRAMTILVGIFFIIVSVFMAQLDYINMFLSIMTGLWLGASGPIMIGGLYSRFGTTTGAFCALIFGSGISLSGMLCQRNWADIIYPWLMKHGYVEGIGSFLETISAPFNPYIVWKMSDVKFPINSYEIYFIAMFMGCLAYVVGSLLTYRQPYNLDRMLHRGKYALPGEKVVAQKWTLRNTFSKLIGITSEYTRGDRIIAWSVFGYIFVFQFVISFVCVLIWNYFYEWPELWWSYYFYFNLVVLGIIIGIVSTIWFFVGGVIDLRRLLKDLKIRKDNPLDDGRVSGNVSLVDKEVITKIK